MDKKNNEKIVENGVEIPELIDEMKKFPWYGVFTSTNFEVKRKTLLAACYMKNEISGTSHRVEEAKEWAFGGHSEEGYKQRGTFCKTLSEKMTVTGLLGSVKTVEDCLTQGKERNYSLKDMFEDLEKHMEEDPQFPYRQEM